MEVLFLAGIAGLVVWLNQRSHPSSSTPPAPADPTPPIQPFGPGTPAPPTPPPASATGPGVYPPGTPGAFPVVLFVVGGDNDARLYATPGSYAGPTGPKTVTVWYGPGTQVVFSARVDPSLLSVLTAFDHFEGPGGMVSRQNPFTATISGPGFVRAVFAWAGRVGG